MAGVGKSYTHEVLNELAGPLTSRYFPDARWFAGSLPN